MLRLSPRGTPNWKSCRSWHFRAAFAWVQDHFSPSWQPLALAAFSSVALLLVARAEVLSYHSSLLVQRPLSRLQHLVSSTLLALSVYGLETTTTTTTARTMDHLIPIQLSVFFVRCCFFYSHHCSITSLCFLTLYRLLRLRLTHTPQFRFPFLQSSCYLKNVKLLTLLFYATTASSALLNLSQTPQNKRTIVRSEIFTWHLAPLGDTLFR